MKNKKPISRITDDIKRADNICRALRTGNADAIDGLCREYQSFFMAIASRRVYEPDDAEDVLSGFWLKIIESKGASSPDQRKN